MNKKGSQSPLAFISKKLEDGSLSQHNLNQNQRKENKNKKGIYLLVNLINGNFYIGSSINLSNRMQNYLNIKYLNTNSNKNMPIIKSLLKYGHDNFALLILEYIDSEDISERETY